MNIKYRLFTKIIAFLWFVFPIYSSEIAEEGWRYHGTLKVKMQLVDKEKEVDFSDVHMDMAKIIQDDADDKQYSSMLRFTPVFADETSIKTGVTVQLKPIHSLQSSVSFEVAFANGMYPRASQDAVLKCRTSIDLEIKQPDSSVPVRKIDILTLRSAIHSKGAGKEKEYRPNSHPIRFAVANYFDMGVLEDQLRFRYVPTTTALPVLFFQGNARAIVSPHQEVLKNIETRKKELDEETQQLQRDLQNNDTKEVMAHYTQKFSEKPPVNSHPATGSYTCAEQANLNYLYDHRVIKYLQTFLGVDKPNFIGLIIHSHCSHTPCHTCATSFTRESEHGGIFRNISENKPIQLLCSCVEHYKRPEQMLGYDKTKFAETVKEKKENETTIFDLSRENTPPYPIVKLIPSSLEIDTRYLQQLGLTQK